MPVYEWEADKEQILARIKIPATLKICVKLLDEPLLIESWIQHHAKIIGFENLIIADNGSTDPATLEIYAKYAALATIFRFAGPHNEIHWHPRFADLFAVIRQSCKYFSFVDVDERLIFLKPDAWTADSSIVEMLAEEQETGIIPATWLINTLNGVDTFTLLDSESRPNLINNLKWGKPIFRASLAGSQGGIHNIQNVRDGVCDRYGTSFVLLHFTQFPERRIAVNRNKLISRGVVDRSKSIDDIALLNLTDFEDRPDKSFFRFVTEIRKMREIIAAGNDAVLPPVADFLKLESDGSILYSNDDVRASLSDFISHGVAKIERTFHADKWEEKLTDAPSLFEAALNFRQNAEGVRSEKLLLRGLELYPGYLDRYGMPAFRKELMRTYLAQRKWDDAERLIPSKGEAGSVTWHYILFARAFTQIGDTEAAAKWWGLVLAEDPKSWEARQFFQLS